MNNLSAVLGFTIRNKFRSKAFIITTIILALLVSVGVNVPYLITLFKSDKAINIGMLEDGTNVGEQLKLYYDAAEKKEVNLLVYPNEDSVEASELMLKEQIADGEIEGYLMATEEISFGFPIIMYKSEDTMDYGTMNKLQNGLQQVKMGMVVQELKLSKEQLDTLSAPVQIDKVQISATGGAGSIGDGKSEEQIAVATGMVYVLIIMLFMGVMISGQLIATEITAEKSSRVMEILITSVSPLTQMFGKIIGMFIVALSQITLLVAAIAINLMLPHNRDAISELNINLSDIDPMLLVYAIFFYLTGYFLYATMFAAVGSLVSRTEDLGQAILPITMLTMVGYFIAIYGIQDPNSMLVQITSFIPFFSPFIMFLRLGTTDPAVWEVVLSFAILLVSILGIGWLASRIYRAGVLMYGKRPSFKELMRAMRAYRA
ncbi:MAG: ABC transporter permease [Paenibacillaceae bacterium]